MSKNSIQIHIRFTRAQLAQIIAGYRQNPLTSLPTKVSDIIRPLVLIGKDQLTANDAIQASNEDFVYLDSLTSQTKRFISKQQDVVSTYQPIQPETLSTALPSSKPLLNTISEDIIFQDHLTAAEQTLAKTFIRKLNKNDIIIEDISQKNVFTWFTDRPAYDALGNVISDEEIAEMERDLYTRLLNAVLKTFLPNLNFHDTKCSLTAGCKVVFTNLLSDKGMTIEDYLKNFNDLE